MKEPPVPSCVDLRDFSFMPIEVRRLLTSETWMTASGDAKGASISLWLESWHQVPASSLPDNDRALAQMSQAGASWKKIKEQVLAGWVRCSDGRIYHPVVAAKALEAWLEKLAQRISSNAGNSSRWGLDFDKAALEARMEQARNMLTVLDPQSRALTKKRTARVRPDFQSTPKPVPTGVPPSNPDGTPDGTPNGVPILSQETETGTETSLKKKEESPNGDSSSPAVPPGDIAAKRTAKEAAKAQRLAAVTDEAVLAFNATLGKPHGLLPAVSSVGREKRRQQVGRCLKIASEICQEQFGDRTIVPAFWAGYFGICSEDEFYAGRKPGGKGHENYVPDFELLTRPETMLKLYDRADADGAAA